MISMLIAIKFNNDFYYDNSFYSKIGGISLNDFNLLEKEFLFLINFHLFIT